MGYRRTPGWARSCIGAAWALLLAAAVQAAPPTLDFGHFALRTTAVSVKIDGAVVRTDIAYRGFTTRLPVRPGTRHVSVADARGAIIAESMIELRDGDGLTMFLAGEGSQRAPYVLRVSVDHNLPLENGAVSVQTTNLALPGVGDIGVPPLYVAKRCATLSSNLRFETVPYGLGSADPGDPDFRLAANGLNLGRSEPCALLISLNPQGTGATEFRRTGSAGERRRVVYAGDGVEQPIEAVMIVQAIEPAPAVLTPSAAFDGLWYDPNVPGAAWEIAFQRDADGTPSMRAIIHTFDAQQRPRWRVFDGSRVLQVVGGTPDGVLGTDRFPIVPARLLIHSCFRATFVPQAGSSISGIPGGEFPRHAITLYKLLPVGGCLDPDIG